MTQIRVFNNGAGVQSTAALVLAARGKIDYRVFIRANVGDDSENPETIAYYDQVHRPFAAAHGITLIDVRHTKKDDSQPTLLERIYTPHGVPIPIRGSNGMPLSRSCTGDFKIKPITKWLKRQGATKDNPAISGLGISMDEFQRMKNTSGIAWQHLDYPLITLRLSRDDCKRIIATAGLPPTPESSCWFCPFHRLSTWQKMHDQHTDLFNQSVHIEQFLSKKKHRSRQVANVYDAIRHSARSSRYEQSGGNGLG